MAYYDEQTISDSDKSDLNFISLLTSVMGYQSIIEHLTGKEYTYVSNKTELD